MVDNLFGNGQSIAVGSNHGNTTQDEPEPWESGICNIPDVDIQALGGGLSYRKTLYQDRFAIKLPPEYSAGEMWT